MCFASAYRLRFRLLPHARRLSVLTTTLRPPMPVGGSFHDAFALRFYSHETWQHPPYLWGTFAPMANIRTNRHCKSHVCQLAQVTNKTEIKGPPDGVPSGPTNNSPAPGCGRGLEFRR